MHASQPAAPAGPAIWDMPPHASPHSFAQLAARHVFKLPAKLMSGESGATELLITHCARHDGSPWQVVRHAARGPHCAEAPQSWAAWAHRVFVQNAHSSC